MVRVRSPGVAPWTRRTSWAAGAAVLFVALETSMIPLPAGDGWVPGAPDSFLRSSVSGPSLVVDPPTWWLAAGNSTRLAATWTAIPPGCAATSLWFRWSLATGFAEGTLDAVDGTSVNFTAGFAVSGTAQVEARSTVLVTCGSDQVATYGTAVSTITVVAPLGIENVSLAPNLVETGTTSSLSAVLFGGQPPYRLRIDWDDGNVSFHNVSAPGPFSFAHRFAGGTFSPTILATDATGLTARGSVDGPLSASSGLAVAVVTPTVATEVGVPVHFSGAILNPPAEYGSVTLCTDATLSQATEPSGNVSDENFTCTFAAPGSAEVDFEVIPIADDLPPAETRWWEPVAPPLALNVSPPGVMGEVGRPTVFTARLSGGVPPFLLSWRLAGNSSVQQESAFVDGSVLLPVWPSEAGTYALTVTVEDALGVLVAAGTASLPVNPPLNVVASADRILSLGGAVVRVSAAVSQGTAPFLWWVLPAVDPIDESPPNGTLGSVDSFSWNGTLAREGNSTVSIVVVDGAGAVGWESVAVPLVPELGAMADATAASGGPGRALRLNVSILGGLPPFDLWVNSSDSEEWNRSLNVDGAYSFLLPTNDSGPVSLGLNLRDGLGAEWVDTLSVEFPPSRTPPNASLPLNATSSELLSNSAWGLLALLLVVATAGGAYALFRRRGHRPAGEAASTADPVAVLRRILEPAEGADRATVELMAEEAGVPFDVARTTIDRLVSEGSIRSESGPDGEEVLAWSDRDDS